MRLRPLILMAALALSSAATADNKVIVGPNGKPVIVFSCGGHISECYEEAGRTCPSGYGVVTSDQTGTTGLGAAVAHLAIVSGEQNHELLVQCRGQIRMSHLTGAPDDPDIKPDGTVTYTPTCHHTADDCNEDAAKDCPTGYTVVTLKQSGMGVFKKFHMTVSCHEDAVDR
jgi:hypothetical protein